MKHRLDETMLTRKPGQKMQSILERGVKKEKLRKGVHSPYLKAKFKTKMLILVTIFRILRNQENA